MLPLLQFAHALPPRRPEQPRKHRVSEYVLSDPAKDTADDGGELRTDSDEPERRFLRVAAKTGEEGVVCEKGCERENIGRESSGDVQRPAEVSYGKRKPSVEWRTRGDEESKPR